MTKFMKFEVILYYVLKVFGHFCGWVGVFGVIGFPGGLEFDRITVGQFWLYEFHAFCLIGLCIIVYIFREYIKEDVYRQARMIKRRMARAKRLANAQ